VLCVTKPQTFDLCRGGAAYDNGAQHGLFADAMAHHWGELLGIQFQGSHFACTAAHGEKTRSTVVVAFWPREQTPGPKTAGQVGQTP